jgi:hypothetical protein
MTVETKAKKPAGSRLKMMVMMVMSPSAHEAD